MSKKAYFLHLVTAATLLLTLSTFRVVCQQIVLVNDNSPEVTITGSGPSQYYLNETVTEALGSCQVRDFLNGTRYRVLSSEFQSNTDGYGDMKTSMGVYHATIYDYTHGRTFFIRGIPSDPFNLFITETNEQPISNAEELAEAAHIAGVRPHDIVHDSMPPVISRDFPDGTSQRILNIAVTSANSTRGVHVNMNNRTVESTKVYSEKPLTCEVVEPASGYPSDQGIQGTANFVITQGGKKLWTFQAIRPSASSGIKGSGIELQNVKYKGKTLLSRAHVPILNVEYDPVEPDNECGPFFRDWQYDEFFFECKGRDITPGFRFCNSPAKTILDPPHVDGGDFMGVAVYVDGSEVVLKTQLSAAWYRYISEWRFHVGGTLKPRWGFGGVIGAGICICEPHHHHVYWRFDFDIVTPGNNIVREFNNPPIIGNSNYHDKIYEIQRPRDASHRRHWEISNTKTHSTYSLIPGSNDGKSTAFGVGDVWVLRYHSDELDDGLPKIFIHGPPDLLRANINKFVNGEPVKDKDVVVWYGAHFRHDQSHEPEGGVNHVVGPNILPVKWP